MIIEAIVNALAAVLNPVIELLPVWSPLDLEGMLAPALDPIDQNPFWMTALTYGDRYVPITESILVLGLSASIWVSAVGFRAGMWLLRVFHISGND